MVACSLLSAQADAETKEISEVDLLKYENVEDGCQRSSSPVCMTFSPGTPVLYKRHVLYGMFISVL